MMNLTEKPSGVAAESAIAELNSCITRFATTRSITRPAGGELNQRCANRDDHALSQGREPPTLYPVAGVECKVRMKFGRLSRTNVFAGSDSAVMVVGQV